MHFIVVYGYQAAETDVDQPDSCHSLWQHLTTRHFDAALETWIYVWSALA